MAGRLVDGQANLIEPRNVHNLSTSVTVHIVVGEVGDDLLQSYDILIGRLILGDVVAENGHFLVRRRLSAIHGQCWTIPVVCEQVVVDEASERRCRAPRIRSDPQTSLILLH